MTRKPSPQKIAGSAPRAPRLVGRIVDGDVRDDGGREPSLALVARSGAQAGEERSAQSGSHPVRDRLLAKARAAAAARAELERQHAASQQAREISPREGLAESEASGEEAQQTEFFVSDAELEAGDREMVGVDALPAVCDDLDQIGVAPAREETGPGGAEDGLPSAPSSAAAVVGASVALAAVFGVLTQLSPREPLTQAARVAEAEPLRRPEEKPRAAQAQQLAERTVQHPPRAPIAGPWRVQQAAEDPELLLVRGAVGKRSLLVAMEKKGVSVPQGFRVLTALKGLRDWDHCNPRHEFLALLSRETGRVQAFEYLASEEEVYQARTGDDGLLHGEQLDLAVVHQRARGYIRMGEDFDASALRAGFEPGLRRLVDKALAGHITAADMKPGDVLGLVVQEVTRLGSFSRYAGIEALEYRRAGQKPLRIYYHDAGKTKGYVDDGGRMFGRGRWAKPVRGAVRTSRFNPKRLHPILKVVRPHNGTDFAAPTGTPVIAAAQGRITYVGKRGPNGNFVRIAHSGGYQTGYSHLQRFAKGLRRGARVEQRQVIGYVGSTGRSTGPHLHFSAKKHGRYIDPESLDLDAFARLPVSDRRYLARLRARYDELLEKLSMPEAEAFEPSSAPPRPAPEKLEAHFPELVRAVAPAGPEASGEPKQRAAALRPASSPWAAAGPGLAPAVAPVSEPLPVATPVQAAGEPPLSIYLSDVELMRAQPAVRSREGER